MKCVASKYVAEPSKVTSKYIWYTLARWSSPGNKRRKIFGQYIGFQGGHFPTLSYTFLQPTKQGVTWSTGSKRSIWFAHISISVRVTCAQGPVWFPPIRNYLIIKIIKVHKCKFFSLWCSSSLFNQTLWKQRSQPIRPAPEAQTTHWSKSADENLGPESSSFLTSINQSPHKNLSDLANTFWPDQTRCWKTNCANCAQIGNPGDWFLPRC